MTQRKCWGQPVIYSCAEAEFEYESCDLMRTRFALDDRLNNDYVAGAGFVETNGRFSDEGLALRPFPFRVATHSDSGLGPRCDDTDAPYWNSCQGKDGCGDAGEHDIGMSEARMIRWLLEDAR